MNKIVFVPMFTVLVAFGLAQEHSPHWSYEGASGPEHWAELSPEYATCGKGQSQSPINIIHPLKAQLPPIEFHYLPSPLRLIDNGHTVQVNYTPGSYISVSGRKYELVQFHFHHPSEEEINGKRADLVIHLVHKDSEGQLAVVAVLLAQGASNPAIDTLARHLPDVKEQEMSPGTTINAADFLPADRNYYTFAGSLTTPPCTEGVTWFVLRRRLTLSQQELATLARLYPHNARPVQPMHSRTVRAAK
jgi:carbonic anhydrase